MTQEVAKATTMLTFNAIIIIEKCWRGAAREAETVCNSLEAAPNHVLSKIIRSWLMALVLRLQQAEVVMCPARVGGHKHPEPNVVD
jgi:hypothetical protein